MPLRVPFDNSYARLPERFFTKTPPTPVRAPRLIRVNDGLAALLGLDGQTLRSEDGIAVLAGNVVAPGSEPLAQAYAGHQFGHFVPRLGDGRAILLGEVVGTDGVRRDIQLKGGGPTPFSRGGDGRAALGPVLREYLVSEAMFALGIPTTRSLAAVTTGEPVFRDEVLPGAIVTRVATSHLRVGTFEYFAARGDADALATLTAYALRRHYPAAVPSADAAGASTNAGDAAKEARLLLENVIAAQARLVALWLGVGFVHGVMNTDNTTISGETIDFGPCAFLDEFHPDKVFSSIDRGGRYAYGSQPKILHWNMTRLAITLVPLLADDEERATAVAKECLDAYGPLFETAFAGVLRAKLGLTDVADDDAVHRVASDLLGRMAGNAVDYTVFFRRLCDSARDPRADESLAPMFEDPGAFHTWAESWRALHTDGVTKAARVQAMSRANPAFIPRNHRIEEAIRAAVEKDDFTAFHTLVDVLARPYDDQPEAAHLMEPPRAFERVTKTFCGT